MAKRDPNAPLGAGTACDRILALAAEEQRETAAAVVAVKMRFNAKRAKLRERVPEDQRPHLDRMLAAMTPAEPSGDIPGEAPREDTTAEEPGRGLPAWATAEPEGDPPIVVERGERKTGARRG